VSAATSIKRDPLQKEIEELVCATKAAEAKKRPGKAELSFRIKYRAMRVWTQ
jgi:hypothetical protein